MKKFVKSLIGALIVSLATTIVVEKINAQSSTATFLINSNVVTNLLITGPLTIKRVTFSGFGNFPAAYFYDYNTNGSISLNTLQYSNTTSITNQYVTYQNITNSVIFTNSLGQLATNKYWGQYSVLTNINTATLSNAAQIGAIATQSGVPYTLDVNWNIVNGLTVRGTNNASCAIILEYQ